MLRAVQVLSSLFPAAQPVDYALQPGKVSVIVGPNGAGKTTLLKLLSGEQTPLRGQVLLNGRPIADWPAVDRARQLAVLPQQSLLNFPFTVTEVVALARLPHATGRRRDAEIVRRMLQLLGAESLSGRIYTHLSGGEKQRVQIARVLAQIWQDRPNSSGRCLILDEPTSSLDLEHQQTALRAIRTLTSQGCGVAMVAHDLNLTAAIADTIVMLKDGTVHAQGPPWEVLTTGNIEAVFSVKMAVNQDADSRRPFLMLTDTGP